jgi:putative transposase
MLFVWQFVLNLVAVMGITDNEKDLEIMLLRQQLRIVERKQQRGPQIPHWQKVPLAALAARMKDKASNAPEALTESIRLFKPDTLIGWHRELVRHKWMFKPGRKPGRPPIDRELEGWVRQVARDNPTLGYDKLEGELRKLGFDVGATTIRIDQFGLIKQLRMVCKGSLRTRFWLKIAICNCPTPTGTTIDKDHILC